MIATLSSTAGLDVQSHAVDNSTGMTALEQDKMVSEVGEKLTNYDSGCQHMHSWQVRRP